MVIPTSHVMQFFIVGICFRREAVTRNLFLKMKLSSKYPKIKPFENYPLYDIILYRYSGHFFQVRNHFFRQAAGPVVPAAIKH